ncbi:MAG: hypothetical protein WAM94_11130 [Chromatiaceae bacterium]
METATGRQKPMFRVTARVDPDLLRNYLEAVKTGLPGVAWIRLDTAARWPAVLADRVME